MLTLSNLTCRMTGRTLIEDSSVQISDGWRVGLVGANGTGKSTLFRLLTGDLQPDQGDITVSQKQRIGIVRQDMPDIDTPVLELVLQADAERTTLLAASETETDPYKIGDIHTRLAEIDAYSAPSRAAQILSGLGFSDEQMNGPYNALSGGWRMRVALASVLFQQPDLLLLDEPTNHLDLEAIIWLEGYLVNYPHTVIIISHDRELLNTCASHIVHLYDHKLTLYTGNYDNFERTRAEKLDLQQKMHEKQAAQRAHIQSFIDRFRAKATKARQAQSRLKFLEKMDVIDAVMADRAIRFGFPQPEKMPPPLIALDKVSVGYGAGKTTLRQINDSIDSDDRIALLGANGNGKSTLIKLLAGKLEAQSGDMMRTPKLRIGYFSQHQTEELDVRDTPYEALLRLLGQRNEDTKEAVVRARLGQFGFSKDMMDTKIGSLSGGEKARLLFCFMSLDAPHMLLLDEPTNHLDMDAREALIDALNSYQGAVVIVSHDPRMLERVADRLWLVNDGTVQDFDGDLADYRKFVIERQRAARREDKAPRVDDKAEQRKRSADLRRELAPLSKKVEQAEKLVAKLLKQQEELENTMAAPDFYTQNPTRQQDVQRQHGALLKEIATAEENWLMAQDAYDTAKRAAEA
jgi:ATP-binding cassette subfamily F protein 3